MYVYFYRRSVSAAHFFTREENLYSTKNTNNNSNTDQIGQMCELYTFTKRYYSLQSMTVDSSIYVLSAEKKRTGGAAQCHAARDDRNFAKYARRTDTMFHARSYADAAAVEIITARVGRACYLHAVLSLASSNRGGGTCLCGRKRGGGSVTSSTRHRSRARHINFISTTSTDIYIGIFDDDGAATAA